MTTLTLNPATAVASAVVPSNTLKPSSTLRPASGPILASASAGTKTLTPAT